MSRRLYILAGILTLVAALGLTDAFAGSTGKITGQVVDEKGEPLPGANVVIKGSRQGATADAEGHYVILAVDPGTYELVASLIGYNTVTKQGVQVSVDATTPLDFDLQERTIEAEEIVVQAKAPLVERDKTSTKYTVSADEIRQVPIIRTTSEFISLLPGVDMGGTFSVRGSDYARAVQPVIWATSGYNSADVYVIIDGVRVPRGDGNSAGLFTGVNKSAVQQMSVETGVAPAEYGDAKAGSVSIVTRDGGKEYHGWTEITYEPAGKKHWGANIYDAPGTQGQHEVGRPGVGAGDRPANGPGYPRSRELHRLPRGCAGGQSNGADWVEGVICGLAEARATGACLSGCGKPRFLQRFPARALY